MLVTMAYLASTKPGKAQRQAHLWRPFADGIVDVTVALQTQPSEEQGTDCAMTALQIVSEMYLKVCRPADG